MRVRTHSIYVLRTPTQPYKADGVCLSTCVSQLFLFYRLAQTHDVDIVCLPSARVHIQYCLPSPSRSSMRDVSKRTCECLRMSMSTACMCTTVLLHVCMPFVIDLFGNEENCTSSETMSLLPPHVPQTKIMRKITQIISP